MKEGNVVNELDAAIRRVMYPGSDLMEMGTGREQFIDFAADAILSGDWKRPWINDATVADLLEVYIWMNQHCFGSNRNNVDLLSFSLLYTGASILEQVKFRAGFIDSIEHLLSPA